MSEFKFNLGDVVGMDPTAEYQGTRGRVIGQVRYIDGTVGYIVSVWCYKSQAIRDHKVNEHDICLIEPEGSE